MKGYRTLAISGATILAALLAFLNNTDLPGVAIDVLHLFGVTASPDTVSAVLFVLVGIVGFVLRLVTDTPAGQSK